MKKKSHKIAGTIHHKMGEIKEWAGRTVGNAAQEAEGKAKKLAAEEEMALPPDKDPGPPPPKRVTRDDQAPMSEHTVIGQEP